MKMLIICCTEWFFMHHMLPLFSDNMPGFTAEPSAADENHVMNAHCVIVASRCDWFRRALLSGMKESIQKYTLLALLWKLSLSCLNEWITLLDLSFGNFQENSDSRYKRSRFYHFLGIFVLRISGYESFICRTAYWSSGDWWPIWGDFHFSINFFQIFTVLLSGFSRLFVMKFTCNAFHDIFHKYDNWN